METQSLTEKLLTDVWGGPVQLDNPQSLGGSGRSHVIRYALTKSPLSSPETVVVKHALAGGNEKYDPDVTDGPANRLFNDWAGLQFLSECFAEADDIPIPRFIAGDRASGTIVMHDIGTGKGLDHYLLGHDPDAAAECMTALMATVGRVHAVTCGKQARYDAIRDALGPRKIQPLSEHIDWHRDNQAKGLTRLGIATPDGFADEVVELITEYHGDSPFRVYSHNDPCPDNVLWIDGRMTLLDFEFSGMANAAVDMRYPRAAWPTCWCANRTPQPLLERLESAYRSELVKGCPEAADDDRFYRQLAAGCAEAGMGLLGREYVEWFLNKSVKLGSFDLIQKLLARLDGFVQVSEEHNQFPILGSLARQSAQAIRKQLPDNFFDLPIYMAFR